MQHTSYIEISESAYQHNIKYFRKLLGKNVRISSVVKGNAYGHGIENIIPLAENAKVNHFAAFSASEALEVFKVISPGSNIMIMGYLDDTQLEWAIENGIEFYVFDMDRLEKAIAIAKKIGKAAHIHIEAETGFHRTGFEYTSLLALVHLMKKNKEHIRFTGLCTHYAGAESISNHHRVINQIAEFKRFYSY
ncbi:MAG: alanine racemase, partial [Bacteroidales bacterium]|nr:alanine racemase [Bacteroidales bacterium]